MTDPFEDAVRNAARGLGRASGSSDVPTYHDAWNLGRRRRAQKQIGMAGAGALLFLAAIGLSQGSFRSTTSEVDGVALSVDVATAVPVATTEPLSIATAVAGPDVAEPDAAPTAGAPAATAVDASPTATPEPVASSVAAPTPALDPPTNRPAEAPAAPAGPPANVEVAATATAVPAPPAPSPTPTEFPDLGLQVTPTAVPIPNRAPAPTATATPIPTAAEVPMPPPPTVTSAPVPTPTPTPTPEIFTGEQTSNGVPDPPQTAGTPTPTPIQAPAAGDVADAVVIEPNASGDVFCDTDGDTSVDATCGLKPAYSCEDADTPTAGYTAFDDDGDDIIDTCRATNLPDCDTTGDGFGDTPCTISPLPTGD